MQFVCDFHLHSKYSRAVSKDMVLPMMARMAALKGLDIITLSDWTHPLWLKEARMQLQESAEGLYSLKEGSEKEKKIQFLLSTEISSIFSQGGRVRRIHNLVFAPSFEVAEAINKELQKRGCNLFSDGRPIIGLSSRTLLDLILSVDERCMLIPCHVWTPHFGLYGSASGFDSIEESFSELSQYVYGIETGLSSDPEMNWTMKELEKRSILSFSDAHSPLKMGREATVLELSEPSYRTIRKAFRKREEENKVVYTIEFYPEEGKYHYSGHRNCGIVRDAKEIAQEGDICPACKKKLTEGVFYRVQQLGSSLEEVASEQKQNSNSLLWYTDPKKIHPPYVKLVPLLEIVAESLSSSVASGKAKALFESLCVEFGSEIEVLLKTPIKRIESFAQGRVAEGIEKVRRGDIAIEPGYDGVYGVVKIWEEKKQTRKKHQGEKKTQIGLF